MQTRHLERAADPPGASSTDTLPHAVADTPVSSASVWPRSWPARIAAREPALSFLLVLALASLLRLPFPDLTPFGHDEALEAERARPIWFGARPVDSEITSWFIPDPAGLLYVFALAEPFPQPAVARVVLVSLLNVASVLLCYALARTFFGARVGLLAGLLYAVNPWAVTFGRQPWVITQPLLTTVMLFAALMVVARRDRRWIVPFFIAGAAQTQTHLLAVLFGPPVLLTLLLFARRWLAPVLVPAVLAAVAIVAPYALHLWAIRDSLTEALSRGNRGLTLLPDGTALRLTGWLISGLELEAKLGEADPWLTLLRWPLLAGAGVASLLLVVGVAVAGRACLKRAPGWEADALVLIWMLAPLTLMTWQSSQVYIHYVLCLVPVPFVLMARGAAWLGGGGASIPSPPSPRSRTRERGRPLESAGAGRAGGGGRLPAGRGGLAVVVAAAVAALLVVQVASIVAFAAALDRTVSAPRSEITPTAQQQALNRADLVTRQRGIGELHGLPLRYWQAVADRTRAAAHAAGIRRVTVVSGILTDGDRHLDKRRKALSYLLGPDLEVRFPLEGLIVVPTREDVLILALPEQDLPRIAGRGAVKVLELQYPGTSGDTRVWRVQARPPAELLPTRMQVDLPIEHGIRLAGFEGPRRAQPGQTVPYVVALWVTGEVDPGGEGGGRPAGGQAVATRTDGSAGQAGRTGQDNAAPILDDVAPFVELVGASGQRLAFESRSGLPGAQWAPGDLLIQRLDLTIPVSVAPAEYTPRVGLTAGDATAAPPSTLLVR